MFGNHDAHRGVLLCASTYSIACTNLHNRVVRAALLCIHSSPAGMSRASFQSEQSQHNPISGHASQSEKAEMHNHLMSKCWYRV